VLRLDTHVAPIGELPGRRGFRKPVCSSCDPGATPYALRYAHPQRSANPLLPDPTRPTCGDLKCKPRCLPRVSKPSGGSRNTRRRQSWRPFLQHLWSSVRYSQPGCFREPLASLHKIGSPPCVPICDYPRSTAWIWTFMPVPACNTVGVAVRDSFTESFCNIYEPWLSIIKRDRLQGMHAC
jgi:hypothetical protein